jgi:DNA-binding Lrp family transcriptional regulator
MTGREIALVDRWQRGFPLVEQPFALVGESVGLSPAATIDLFGSLVAAGVISRIGAVVLPHSIGASTLAAMAVPAGQIDAVARRVAAEPMVTHNYEREHALNLWFVVAGPDRRAVDATLARIAADAGLPVIDLPLLKAYHLDLGFPLAQSEGKRRAPVEPHSGYRADAGDRALLGAIEDGLPLVERPYREVGRRIGLAENDVMARLARLSAAGIVTRFGCVVRHRTLGYVANAMTVWDIPDCRIDAIAARFIADPRVTLCYRRPRRLPHWPYNLFCMVHARSRDTARAAISDLNAQAGTAALDQAVLFSTRCFKQRGAVFSDRRQGLD